MLSVFYKLHGIGNDYIYFDCFDRELPDPEKLAIRLSDRRFSIGGDGIILVLKSDVADGRMRMFNADGSEGKMCGNGIRCVGKFLYEVKGIHKNPLTVETPSGIKTLYLSVEDGKVCSVKVDMGAPVLQAERVPVLFEGEAINVPLIVGDTTYRVNCVSMGNPHCVVFVEDTKSIDLERIGRMFELHPAFPESVNTEFVQVNRENELTMRVWERGSGETLACGTGACAAVVAAVCNGLCKRNQDVLVHLSGGDLTINYTDESVFMTGSAVFVYRGEIQL